MLHEKTSFRMTTRIYVGNLPSSYDERELRELLGADGRHVGDVLAVVDRKTGRRRGFVFVTMGSPLDAERAVQTVNGASFGGRVLTVCEAKTHESPWRPPGGR